MHDHLIRANLPSRRYLFMALAAMALAALLSPPGHAQGPPETLTAEQREQLEKQAAELYQAGFQAYQRGDLTAALDSTKRSLQIREKLYPKNRYAQGHPDLATSLNNLGVLLEADGSYGEARGYYERALAMRESLYPKDRCPEGHPDLATSLNNLALLLQADGSYVEARGYCERALAMRESLYPKDRYHQGHPDLAGSLNNLGFVLQAQGSYGESRGYYERALAMYQALYPNWR